jgi:hypothetical protein
VSHSGDECSGFLNDTFCDNLSSCSVVGMDFDPVHGIRTEFLWPSGEVVPGIGEI